MNLREALLKEHTAKQMQKIANYVGDSSSKFNDLIGVFIKGPYKVTQRASWPISTIIEQHPHLVVKHFPLLLKEVNNPNHHPAIKRNIIRLLQFVDIPRRYQGKVADLCFDYLNNPKEAAAVRAFALTVLSNLAKREPSLLNELKIIIEDQSAYANPSFLARARKVLKETRDKKVQHPSPMQ